MVAPATHKLSLPKTGPSQHALQPHWRQVGRYSTVETAEQKVDELRSEGLDAVVSMIDGLSVIVWDDDRAPC